MVDDCYKLDDSITAEDGIVWVCNVYHVEGYKLCSLGVAFAKGYIQLYFAVGFDFFASEADKWVLRFVEVFFCETHLYEALPGQDIRGATIVDEDLTNIISREAYRIFPNVCSNDEGVVLRVVLKPEIGFRESNWDIGPGGAEMFAFADVRDGAEVFFPLTLRLMHWLV